MNRLVKTRSTYDLAYASLNIWCDTRSFSSSVALRRDCKIDQIWAKSNFFSFKQHFPTLYIERDTCDYDNNILSSTCYRTTIYCHQLVTGTTIYCHQKLKSFTFYFSKKQGVWNISNDKTTSKYIHGVT